MLVMTALGLCLALAGCGQSGSSEVPPPVETTTVLELNFDLEARQVPQSVSSIRVRGYDRDGRLAYGPVTRARSAQILLNDVPVLVKSVRLEYLAADQAVVGLYVTAVELRPLQRLVINDPPYEDFQGAPSLTRIEVAPAALNLVTGAQQDCTALGIFNGTVRQDLSPDAHWTVGPEGVATVENAPGSPGRVVAVAPGTTIVRATYAGTTGQANLTVQLGQLLGVAVTPPALTVRVGSSQPLQATGTYTGAYTSDITNQVTWTTDNPAVATVQADGQVTGIAAGSARVTATHVPTGFSANTTITVEALRIVSIVVSPPNPSVPNGREQVFTATATLEDNTPRDVTAEVTWSSTDDTIATVSNLDGFKGHAATHAVGLVTIVATDPSNPSVSGSTTLNVTAKELVSISISPTQPEVPLGLPQQFLATGHYTAGPPRELTQEVIWESTNLEVARVSNEAGSQGLVTTLGLGQSTIKAVVAGSPIQAETTIQVVPATLESIEIAPIDPHLNVGQDRQFTARGRFNNLRTRDITSEVNWDSTDKAVAVVSNADGSRGLATSKAVGQTTITAVHPQFPSVQGSTLLHVDEVALIRVEIEPSDFTLVMGITRQLTATGIYADNTTRDLTQSVDWSSLNPEVAQVGTTEGTKGLVTPVNPGGPCTIRASVPGTEFFGVATVNVSNPVLTGLVVTPKNEKVAKGRTTQFTAMATFEGLAEPVNVTDQVEWHSSAPGVATITSAVAGRAYVANVATGGGLATALNVGHTQITATFPGSTIPDSTDLEVTNAELEEITLEPLGSSRPKGLTVQFRAWGRFSDSATPVELTDSVQWESIPVGRVTFSSEAGQAGLATAREVGLATIKATDPSNPSVSGSTTLNVTSPELLSLRVDPSMATLQPTQTQQFRALATFRDFPQEVDVTETVIWNPRNADVALVSDVAGTKGLATARAGGQTDIIATYPSTTFTNKAVLTVQAAQVGSFTVRILTDGCLQDPSGITVGFYEPPLAIAPGFTATTDANGEVTVNSNQVPPNKCIRIKVSRQGARPLMGGGVSAGAWDGTTGGDWKSADGGRTRGVVIVKTADVDSCTPAQSSVILWGNAPASCQ